MKESPRKTTVTLEDLLRLKRAEQPPAEFWDLFERGLRTKQLAAIVEPRPWWAPLIRVGTRLSRYQLPVGATAVLAITFLTVREYRTADVVQVYEPAGIEVTSVAPATVEVRKAANAGYVSAPAVSSAPMVLADAPARPAAAVEPRPDQISGTATAVGSASHVAPVSPELLMATYIAENMAKNKPPELDQMLGRPVRKEPLSNVNMPGESRRSRLVAGTAWLASAGSTNDSTLRTNDQATRHLTESRLTESDVISRLDVGGDHLGVKF